MDLAIPPNIHVVEIEKPDKIRSAIFIVEKFSDYFPIHLLSKAIIQYLAGTI